MYNSIMKKIKLSNGAYSLIDDDMYEDLSKLKWHCSTSGYVNRHPKMVDGIRIGKIAMHRIVIDANDNQYVDHIDGNKLNNQRNNLRIASYSQNSANSKIPKNNSSGFKGICWHERDKKWTSRIMKNGKRFNLGYFSSKTEAFNVYKKHSIKLNGEFSNV